MVYTESTDFSQLSRLINVTQRSDWKPAGTFPYRRLPLEIKQMILKVHIKDRLIAKQASRNSRHVKERTATRSDDTCTITMTRTDNALVAANAITTLLCLNKESFKELAPVAYKYKNRHLACTTAAHVASLAQNLPKFTDEFLASIGKLTLRIGGEQWRALTAATVAQPNRSSFPTQLRKMIEIFSIFHKRGISPKQVQIHWFVPVKKMHVTRVGALKGIEMHGHTDTQNVRTFTQLLEWASPKVFKGYTACIKPLTEVRRVPRAAVAAGRPSMKRGVVGMAMTFDKGQGRKRVAKVTS